MTGNVRRRQSAKSVGVWFSALALVFVLALGAYDGKLFAETIKIDVRFAADLADVGPGIRAGN